MKWTAALVLAFGLFGCMAFEPNERLAQRPIHEIRPAPEHFAHTVAIPVQSDEEARRAVRQMQAEGWGLVRVHDAAEKGVIPDKPLAHKVILIFEKYAEKGSTLRIPYEPPR